MLRRQRARRHTPSNPQGSRGRSSPPCGKVIRDYKEKRMQKKVLAIAVAGALGAPALAFAQATPGTSTVQIFGTIYAEFDYYNNRAAAGGAPGSDRVNFDYM